MVLPVTDPQDLAELSGSPKPGTPVDPKDAAELAAPSTAPSAFDNFIQQKGTFWDSLRQVAATSPMKPFTSLSDSDPIAKATGDPVSDLLTTAKNIAEFPMRLGATSGGASGPVSDTVADHLGKMGLPAPISAALAMAAGMGADPKNWAIPGADIIDPNEPIGISGVGGKATAERAAQAAGYGIDLSPAQASQNKMLGFLEAVGNRYPYTADDFTKFYTNELAQADGIRAKLMSTLGDTTATQTVSDMMRDHIDSYLQTATPEQASVLQDKFGDLDAYMKKPQAGQFTQSMLAQQRKIALDQAGAKFDALRAAVPDATPIKTPQFSDMANNLLQKELQASPVDQNLPWVKRLTAYANPATSPATIEQITPELLAANKGKSINDIIEGLNQAEPVQPFGGTQATMSKLRDLRIANDPGYLLGIKGQGNTYAGYAAQLRGALSSDIENGLGTVSDQAKQILDTGAVKDPGQVAQLQGAINASSQYADAKTNYAQTKELMNDPFILKLLKNNPEDFLNHAVKPQDITNVGNLKTILGPDNFAPIQQNLLANMLVNKEGELSPTTFINKVDKIGYPTLSKVFDPETLTEIVNSQKTFKNMTAIEKQVGNPSGTAGVLMAKSALFGLPAQAFHLLMNGDVPSAVGVLAGGIAVPKIAAQMYLSDSMRDLLINGVSAPKSSAMALGVMAKAATMAGNRIPTAEPDTDSSAPVPPQAQP